MKEKRKTVLKWMGILWVLIIIIPMVVSVLISFIPEEYEGLQTTLTTMLASAYGGALTLLGVVLTIRQSDKDRKEEEIERAKPYLKVVEGKVADKTLIKSWQTVSTQENFQESKAKNPSHATLQIENIRDATFLYKKMEINNKEVYGSKTVLLTKGNIICFSIEDEYENINKIFNITIYGEDILENRYKYKIQLANDMYWDKSIAAGIGSPILIQK